MSPEIMGLIAGAALGFVGFLSMRFVADTIERNAENRQEAQSKASLVRMLATAELIFFAVLGYVLGPQLFVAA